jgi:hypothetical protein
MGTQQEQKENDITEAAIWSLLFELLLADETEAK